MNKFVLTLLSAVAASAALADVPVYRDQALVLDAAVVVSASGPTYYGDVRFDVNADGSFTLVEAERRNLAYVNGVEILILESFPVQASVEVSGDLSVNCVNLEEPGVYREGKVFTVVLAETPLDPLTLCSMALASYDVSVPLDVYGLEAGEYTVSVNGVETSFTLATDDF